MKRKTQLSRIYVDVFAGLIILLFSANLLFAQCGNYFKPTYSAVDKLDTGFINSAAFDDWTGDGKSDFWNFQRNPVTSNLDVVIYPSKPTGYWDWNNPIIYTTTISNYQLNSTLIVKDFNSDGRTDLLYGVVNIQINYNTGNGALTASPVLNDTDGGTVTVGFADLNGDNLPDWIYTIGINANPFRFELRYKLQNSDGTFSNKNTILIDSSENGLFSSRQYLGDFNGDGKIDIIYDFSSNRRNYVILTNRGGGIFEAAAPVAVDIYIYPGAIRDFNNDGRADILNETAIFYGQADGTLRRNPISNSSGATFPAELNGDNNLDIVEYSPDYYATHINNGAGSFSRTVYQKSLAPSGSLLRFEDFTGDGKADLYYSNQFIPRKRNIFGETLLTASINVCQSFGETKLGNFDGNDSADIIMWNPNTGNWSSKNAKWSSGAETARFFNWGLGSLGDIPSLGDFDGDGKTDYSIYRNGEGNWYIFLSSTSSRAVVRFGLPGDIPVPSDYDGGGKTDIAVYRPSDGNWYVFYSEAQQFGAVHFGTNGDKPVPADYDGDGKADIAIYRPGEGNWYYLRSSDLSYNVIHWGISTDKPVPADYDGDGKADLTIYRNGAWWFLRSSNNSYSVIEWGTAGDIPMPVYQNSVSADMIFYRPSNNSWYSFANRSFQGITLGGNQDIPVTFGLPNN